MKKLSPTCRGRLERKPRVSPQCVSHLAMAGAVLMVWALSLLPAQALQTAAINPQTINYWAGNFTTVGTNSAASGNNLLVNSGGNTNVTFLVTNQPANLVNVAFAPAGLTASGATILSFGVSNPIAAGVYPFQIIGITNGSALDTNIIGNPSANVFLHVVPQWAQTNLNSSGNWSDGSKWSGGSAPSSSDDVYIDHTTVGPWTNVVDTSRTIQSLVVLGNGDEGGSAALALHTVIAPGATLSVLGTNGVVFGKKSKVSGRPWYSVDGDTFVVSNTAATFSLLDATPNSAAYMRVDMSKLTNLNMTVDRVAVADINAIRDSADGSSISDFVMAMTNVITALHTDNYLNATFTPSISYIRENQNMNNGQTANAKFRLGLSNKINADSIGVGLGNGNGSGSGSFGSYFGYVMGFNVSNSVTPTSSAIFRNSDGVSRMSLLAIAVDTGTNTAIAENRGIVDLRGGVVDMKVDKIWISQDRTNTANANAKACLGGLYFDWGTIDCNTLIAGKMQYTNNTDITAAKGIRGDLWVGTNGTLVVNNNLFLGYTPADVTGNPADNAGFAAQAAVAFGNVRIDRGGTIRASKISVGQGTALSVIAVNAGGTLVVSNTIASATNALPTLNLDGANLTFSVTAGSTNAFVTNLNTTVNATKINIASAPFGQSTNVLIAYQTAASHNIGIGTLPAGFNNMSIFDDTANKLILLIISTNQPKNLVWRGGANSQWDHTSLNWQDTNTLATTKFTDGDSVKFDDAAAVPTSITIAEAVNPGQSGAGILVNNSTNSFIFNNSGSGSIGACALVKTGTQGLEIDGNTLIAASINQGSLTIGAGGANSSVTVSANTTFTNAGTVLGGVTCSGSMQNSGVIVGNVSLLSSSSMVNTSAGIVNGTLSMNSGTALYNYGGFTSMGSPTVPTNSLIYNAGYLVGSALNISGTLQDTGTGSDPGTFGFYGNINSSIVLANALTINSGGIFIPGGSGIGTTTITENPPGSVVTTAGRILLSNGSTNIFKVNLDSGILNTKISPNCLSLGPNQNTPAINGGTIIITNTGIAQFSAGQTIQLFQNPYSPAGNIGNAGLNATNSYPIIVPATPGPGLRWDMSQLIFKGKLSVATAPQIAFTNITTVGVSNVVTEFSWDPGYTGGFLQSQTTTLTNGLNPNGTWSTVIGSSAVNDIFVTNVISGPGAIFFRFVYP